MAESYYISFSPTKALNVLDKSLLRQLFQDYPNVAIPIETTLTLGNKEYTVRLEKPLYLTFGKDARKKFQIVGGMIGQGKFGQVLYTERYLMIDPSTGDVELYYNLKPKVIKVETERQLRPEALAREVEATRLLIPKAQLLRAPRRATVHQDFFSKLFSPHKSKTPPQKRSQFISPFLGQNLDRKIVAPGVGYQYQSKDIFFMLEQASNSLRYLHTTGRAHRDVKPSNICLDDFLRLSLVDLGLSHPFYEGKKDLAAGTPGFTAPEISLGFCGASSDVYGLGVTAALLLGCESTSLFLPPVVFHMSGSIETDQLTRVSPEALRPIVQHFLDLMTAEAPAARPSMACCRYFFNFIREEVNPRTVLIRAGQGDFDISALSPVEVCALAQALHILEAPSEEQDPTYQALKACFTTEDFTAVIAHTKTYSTQLQERLVADQACRRDTLTDLVRQSAALIEALSIFETQPPDSTPPLSASLQYRLIRASKQLRKELLPIADRFYQLDPDAPGDILTIFPQIDLLMAMVTDKRHNPLAGRLSPNDSTQLRQSGAFQGFETILEDYLKSFDALRTSPVFTEPAAAETVESSTIPCSNNVPKPN